MEPLTTTTYRVVAKRTFTPKSGGRVGKGQPLTADLEVYPDRKAWVFTNPITGYRVGVPYHYFKPGF